MKKLTVVLLMLAGFGFAGNASAVDGKSHNGSFCHAYYGGQSSNFYHTSMGIKNVSTGKRWVTCPLIKDRLAATNGADPIWVHWTGTGTISCTFYSKFGSGTVAQSTFKADTNGGWFRMPANGSGAKDPKYGTYAMTCYLPKNATLNTIWVDEK
jgi:hypothetical protein